LQFFPDGKRLAVAIGGQLATVDIEAKKEVGRGGNEVNLKATALAPDGNLLATAASGNRWGGIRLWHVGAQKTAAQMGIVLDYECLAFSKDGMLLAGGRPDGTVKLWDVSKYKPKR